MNVMITCAGRRSSLVRAFQEVVSTRNGSVVATDMDSMAPTLRQADVGTVLPPVEAPGYPDALRESIESHDVHLLIPTIDPELPGLADMSTSLEADGVILALSAQSFIRLTRDKLNTLRVFSEQGIRTPKTWTPDESERADWPDPCFIKPRYGSASADARCLPSAHAEMALNRIDTPLIQERVEAPEITVDALFDLDEDRLLHYVPRRRLQTEAGESIQGRTIKDPHLQSWLEEVLRVAGARGARGPLTLQAFLTDPEPTLSEINPRFGGGFPLSHAAGAHYPEWLVRMRSGEDIPPKLGAYEGGLCMARYYDELFFSAPPAS